MARFKLRIIPLGGLGEVGKNMTLFEAGQDAFVVDTGIMFPANDMLGVDYIIPDFRYIVERIKNDGLRVHGILFTHGHEDHIGAVAHVVEALPNVPIYATPLTAGLIDVKLRDAHVENLTKVNIFQSGATLQIGPFKIESFHVCHSIPDCVGFAINTPQGLIVHTGDYKFDNTPVDGKTPDYAKLADFSKRGVLLLMADSTNADQAGWTPSEMVINGAFDKVFREAKGRIIVATFASLISRIQQVAFAAALHGRKIAIAGHSMLKNVDMAREMGILDIPAEMLVDLNHIDSLPAHKVVIMATGAQGEPTAVLGRLATGRHRQLDVQDGDTIVLSAHPIPGNEEMVYRTINKLFRRGANVIYDPIEKVHVSGHAKQEEMRLMIHLTKPQYFLPVHGELRHLKEHCKLAIASGVPKDHVLLAENGMVIEVTRGGVRLDERIPGGYVFVDGSGVGDIGKAVIRDRETLARDGFLMVAINVDRRTGKLLDEPEIISRGFIFMRDAEDLLDQLKDNIAETLMAVAATVNGGGPVLNAARRRERLEETISRFLYNETKRRPMVFTVVNER